MSSRPLPLPSRRLVTAAAVTAAAALTLGLAPVAAQAAVQPATGAAAAAVASGPAAATTDTPNPFAWAELDGLRARQLTTWHGGQPLSHWALTLDEATAARSYTGGVFFLYAPATGDRGFFRNLDLVSATVKDPRQVTVTDAQFIRSHPRVEVRYGDPAQPDRARVVATSTIWM
ncbi:hypothetical protein ACIQWR_20235 [Streptomyces sp. NPDC098789]|uniref:hypothetical protein n=1 Tax=Streptomyces sp. NPDC098789 TaxID=3366098 RepID=UPI00380FBAA1